MQHSSSISKSCDLDERSYSARNDDSLVLFNHNSDEINQMLECEEEYKDEENHGDYHSSDSVSVYSQISYTDAAVFN